MKENFKFKKSLGQNFITDKNLLSAIVADAEVTGNDNVLEIGAGAGALTEALAQKAKKLVSLEVDSDLKELLTEKFKDYKNVEIKFLNALKVSDDEINSFFNSKYKLVANLPYYITTPLIFKFLENETCESLTVMVQKEVAERIVATPGSKDYGIISVKIGALADAKIARVVSRKMFYPMPNVDSAIINIKKKKEVDFNKKIFNYLVDVAFAMRRKTLANNLSDKLLNKEQLSKFFLVTGLNPLIRGEALSISEFIEISKVLEQIRQTN